MRLFSFPVILIRYQKDDRSVPYTVVYNILQKTCDRLYFDVINNDK